MISGWNPFYRTLVLSLMAIAVGVLAALAAIAFFESVAWMNRVLFVSPRSRVQFDGDPMLLVAATLLVPTVGGLLVGLILQKLTREQRPLGPPDVIRSTQLGEPLSDIRSGILSTAAAAISLGFGASVGQYGPIVYLGALIGRLASRVEDWIQAASSISMACGVAAAISTAFNAPIAGLVFAHEVILRHYSMQAFAPVTVASATGYVIANVFFDRPALFLVEFEGVQNGYEFVMFAVIGMISALIAVGFMLLVLGCARVASRLPGSAWMRPGVAGLGVGLTALWLPDVLGIGAEALRFATIEGAFATGELVVLVMAKVLLTALCIGFGFAGGVFSPALLIGILSGAFFWHLLDMSALLPTSGIAVYAVCGMVAVTSSVIGAPLTTILIVFELTRNYDLTVAAMVSVVFSNLISGRMFGKSLFDVQLAARGIELHLGREQAQLRAMRVSLFAVKDYPRVTGQTTVAEALRVHAGKEWNEIFVIDDDGKFLGIFSRSEMPDLSSRVSACLRSPSVVFNERTTVHEAMGALASFVGDAAPLVSARDGRLLGVVPEAAVIRAYLDVSSGLRKEKHASA